MTDKKTFGSFIKMKRSEKNYSQKDFAELLFVTEGAVSKWERGVSYPDITLISDICRVLEISEHELITASTDTDTRKMKQEALKFRTIRDAWFWAPTTAYGLALISCFICNLAYRF
jgi:transcriptional regulator with XRE-family HTH domain